MYWEGALDNIRLAAQLYPGWICRFYVCTSSPSALVDTLRNEHCQIIFMDSTGPYSGLFWRFLAVDDADVMICRDADSRISIRELHAVEEWLKSDKYFHIMRDHPQHTSLIMGGMWGARSLSGLTDAIRSLPPYFYDYKAADQIFLSQYLYPIVKNHAMIHDSYNLFGDGVEFPTPREHDDFVGKVYDPN